MSVPQAQSNINLAAADGAGQRFSGATVLALEALTSDVNGVAVGTLGTTTDSGSLYRCTSATALGSTWEPVSGLWNVLDFGADPSGVADSATAIQNALNRAVNSTRIAAQTGRGEVFGPEGTYLIGATLIVPHGVTFRGVGGASALDTYGTKIRLADNSDVDMIRFTADASGFVHDTHLLWLALDGNKANQAAGHGVNALDAGGAGVIPGQNFRIQDCAIRNVFGDGIRITRRALPFLLKDCMIWDCDGFGFNLTPSEPACQIVTFENLSLDDNEDGGIHIDNTNGSGADVFVFRSLKLEKSQNARQDNHIILEDMQTATVVVSGASLIEAGAVAAAASFIRIEGASQPGYIQFEGVDTRNGTTPVIDDQVSGETVPALVKCGVYQPAVNFTAGTLVGSPLLHLFNTSGALDTKRTRISQSATALEVFGLKDSGATGGKLFTATKSAENWRDLQMNTMFVEANAQAADGDTTPSVAGINELRTANTGPTSITFLDDGLVGQEVTIIMTDANTTIVAAANMKLAGGVNFVGTADDVITLRRIAGGVWVEKSRSVNA